MKIELKVGAAFVSCETDYIPEGGDSMQDALFDRLLQVAIEQADKIWAYSLDAKDGNAVDVE